MNWFFWTPRVLSLFFAAFLVLFSFDVFSMGGTFWELALGFFIHNIPALILLFLIYFSWRNDLLGSLVFFIAGVLYMVLIFFTDMFFLWSLIISGPAFLISLLYLLNWYKSKGDI